MENRKAYAFAHLGGDLELGLLRLRGVGLANMLFPWARYVVGARKFGLQKIAPTWSQIAHRHWIRNDEDKRWYGDLFHPAADEITGPGRLRRLATLKRRLESEAGKFADDPKSMIVFSGKDDYFRDVLAEHATVREALLKITEPKRIRPLSEGYSPAIAVHVRLGDFKAANVPAGVSVTNTRMTNTRISMDWYVNIIQGLRAQLGDLKVEVFSDGTDEELRPLTSLSGVARKTFGSSIADILALSCSAILVSSGSTFSMWASYLGRQPVVWHPGRLFQRLFLDCPEAEIESSGKFPSAFLDHCYRSLSAKGNVVLV